MGFVESLKALIYDILHNLDRINVDYITSNGLNPLRIRHDSGGIIEFRSDGKAYYNDTEIGSGGSGLWEVDGTETQLITADEIDMQDKDIINANSLIANSSTDLTLTVSTGQAFVFSKV